MTVAANFKRAHDFALTLGFKEEAALMKKSSPTGEDESLYAWIRDG